MNGVSRHAPAPLFFIIVVIVALVGCVTNKDYEAMRERAERAEAALVVERAATNDLLRYAAKQNDYIRQLHSGMELQARMAANLRYRCDT